jgi:hypothetical protein
VSAAEALKAARAAGIRLVVDGDDLVLKGSAPPPPVFEPAPTRRRNEE